jgi:hypothetical protein
MGLRRKATALLISVLGVPLTIPAIAYGVGLLRVQGRPVPANPNDYSPEEIAAAWERCRDHLPVSVVPLNPWRYASNLFTGDAGFTGNGQLAAWHVVRAYNFEHSVGVRGWWQLSGAALTIWVTRNWSGEQIGATLVRDELCAVTTNLGVEAEP